MQQKLETALTDLFNQLNKKYFSNGLLPLPVEVTTGKSYLACCCTENGQPVLIRVSIDNINSAEEIAAAILHEMIHAYCIVKQIPHYDPETGRHLQGFMQAAADHGLFYDDFLNVNFIMDGGEKEEDMRY